MLFIVIHDIVLLLLFFSELHMFFKFSILISNMIYTDRYTSHKQQFFIVLNKFT